MAWKGNFFFITGSKLVSLELGEMSLSSEATITDMLYQDGAVYMLLRDYNIDSAITSGIGKNSPLYSRGGIIRYDVLSGAVKVIGWTQDALSSDGKYVYAFYTDTTTDVAPTYHLLTARETGQEDSSKWFKLSYTDENMAAYFPPVYAPASSDSGFYGPQKFIAIKPKKLVISDDGLCFYTDSNDAFCYKNVNRIVTVDLESFVISSADTSLAFASDLTDNPMTGSGFKWENDFNNNWESVYEVFRNNTADGSSSYLGSGGDYFSFGFPCGDDDSE